MSCSAGMLPRVATFWWRGGCFAALLAWGMVPATTEAQAHIPAPSALRQHVCDASLALLSLRVVSRTGEPVQGASVAVRSVKTGAIVARYTGRIDDGSGLYASGSYAVMDDSFIPKLAQQGNEFDIVVRLGSKHARARWRIAAGHCHVKRVAGEDTLTLR